MSTRGLYGLRKNGVDKCTYNHYDSYPDWLGREVLKFCAVNNVERLSRLFDNIEMVDEDSIPTKEQIEFCKKEGYMNLNVGNQNETDWYCLLRNLQGNFKAYTECINRDSKIFMTDRIDFMRSVWCDFVYIINLDYNTLEFYEDYRLALIIPLDNINLNNVDEWVTEMENVLSDED